MSPLETNREDPNNAINLAMRARAAAFMRDIGLEPFATIEPSHGNQTRAQSPARGTVETTGFDYEAVEADRKIRGFRLMDAL